MDPNANAANPQPVNPRSRDIAEAGPINPETGQPDHTVEVSALKLWFRDNFVGLLITAVIVALILIYLDPIDTLKVIIGLGLVSILAPAISAGSGGMMRLPSVGAGSWALGIALALIIGFIVGALPALRAMRLNIVDALAGR